MAAVCDYCGTSRPDRNCWITAYYRDGDESFREYYFCRQIHHDMFDRQTYLTRVNKKGLTLEEEEQKANEEYWRTHSICTDCNLEFLTRTGYKDKNGYYFCSMDCYNEHKENTLYHDAYEKAKNLVLESKICMASTLQRKLKIKYKQALKISEQLEQDGIVGPPDESGKRYLADVYCTHCGVEFKREESYMIEEATGTLGEIDEIEEEDHDMCFCSEECYEMWVKLIEEEKEYVTDVYEGDDDEECIYSCNCEHCGAERDITYTYTINDNDGIDHTFCDEKCASEYYVNQSKCPMCGEIYEEYYPSFIRDRDNDETFDLFFCSSDCFDEFDNKMRI